MAVQTILLIDDDPDQLAVIGQFVQRGGFRVVSAGDVQQAGEILAKESIDLVVADIGLPKMNGMEFAAMLAAKGKAPPVILITAGTIPPDEEILQSGAARFVPKQSLQQLLPEIKAVLGEGK